MDFATLAKTIWDQLGTVASAPVPFIAAMLLVGWLIWLVMRREYSVRLANADSTKELLERQLQEYRDKLDGATPDAAKARIDALDRRLEEVATAWQQRMDELAPRIDALAPKRPSADQFKAVVAALELSRGGTIQIVTDAASPEASFLGRLLAARFNEAGWHVRSGIVLGVGRPPPTGMAVAVPDPDNLTERQEAIFEGLRSLNLPFEVRRGVRALSPEEAVADAELLLTTPLPAE